MLHVLWPERQDKPESPVANAIMAMHNKLTHIHKQIAITFRAIESGQWLCVYAQQRIENARNELSQAVCSLHLQLLANIMLQHITDYSTETTTASCAMLQQVQQIVIFLGLVLFLVGRSLVVDQTDCNFRAMTIMVTSLR